MPVAPFSYPAGFGLFCPLLRSICTQFFIILLLFPMPAHADEWTRSDTYLIQPSLLQ
jgi:hypothetical protein